MLGGIAVLVAAIILVGARRESAGETAERDGVLALGYGLVGGQADVGILLI